ncbi:hypothetical protein SS50377_22291 [Spironucleus salmonicida]|uniref:Protein kish n=1 Tax=Spironucleus salmonicida TaxID=348837 RepID=V6LCK9_9EUKA|nr:hypothetical protein SS50377_22291 [Spironucleus salmonicida]|eukprot:EST42215.1 Transmembrane domain-containing protein [Spironucleus salmonicida]
MVTVWTFEGFIIFALLFICTASYVARIPKLKNFILKEKTGARGTFYKAAVLGIRLHYVISLACFLVGIYKLIL